LTAIRPPDGRPELADLGRLAPPGAFIVSADALDAALDTRNAMIRVFSGVSQPAS